MSSNAWPEQAEAGDPQDFSEEQRQEVVPALDQGELCQDGSIAGGLKHGDMSQPGSPPAAPAGS